jgi:hypothetical protein
LIKQLNTDSAATIHFVHPGAINFGVKLAPKRRSESHDRTWCDFGIDYDCCSAAADFNGLGPELKRLAGDIGAPNLERKLNGNSRIARALRGHNYAPSAFVIHYFFPP